ncbi:hypothetical protein EDB87DRAFT_787308 [Lactarius vividus]|nr:hypothetical protein EDB87DRAFT_787308 [Lactarius vividus]
MNIGSACTQPIDLSGSSTLPPAKDLVLFRTYKDFFDLQTALLETFPREGGRERNDSPSVDDVVEKFQKTGVLYFIPHSDPSQLDTFNFSLISSSIATKLNR